jgi:hypothetical protein
MIGNFPSENPDECLYSIAARYKKRIGYRSGRAVSQDFFGTDSLADIVDIPGRLVYLCNQLPSEFGISTEYLINRTTAFPYFSPFLKPDSHVQAIAAMEGRTSLAPFWTSFRKGPNKAPLFLRYCIDCAVEHRKIRDETYWRRSHQLPCVYVCDAHPSMLANTSLRRGKPLHCKYFRAEEIVPVSAPKRPAIPSDFEVLCWLSQQARWMLENPQPCIDPSRLRDAYRFYLYEQGFASVTGTVWSDKLGTALSKKYERTRLSEFLDIQFAKEDSVKWIRRVLYGSASTAEHLLVMHFLELPVPELSAFLRAPVWFESGPWPCLNPLCHNFRRDVVKNCELTVVSRQMMGTFTCECGYVYQRIGPDRRGEHRNKPYRSVPNEAWDCIVCCMCARRDLSLETIRNTLFTSYAEIRRALIRSGMEVGERSEEFEFHVPAEPPRPDLTRPSSFNMQRRKKRKELQSWLDNHPNATCSEIRNGAGTTVRWLQEHDSAWLKRMLPAQLKVRGRLDQARLVERTHSAMAAKDTGLANRVPSVARELLSAPGRPRRVSASRILQELGFPNGLGNSGRFLPQTQAALRQFSEGLQAGAIRRMQWLIAEGRRTGKRWDLASLLQWSGIHKEWLDQSRSIAEAVDSARRELGL